MCWSICVLHHVWGRFTSTSWSSLSLTNCWLTCLILQGQDIDFQTIPACRRTSLIQSAWWLSQCLMTGTGWNIISHHVPCWHSSVGWRAASWSICWLGCLILHKMPIAHDVLWWLLRVLDIAILGASLISSELHCSPHLGLEYHRQLEGCQLEHFLAWLLHAAWRKMLQLTILACKSDIAVKGFLVIWLDKRIAHSICNWCTIASCRALSWSICWLAKLLQS